VAGLGSEVGYLKIFFLFFFLFFFFFFFSSVRPLPSSEFIFIISYSEEHVLFHDHVKTFFLLAIHNPAVQSSSLA